MGCDMKTISSALWDHIPKLTYLHLYPMPFSASRSMNALLKRAKKIEILDLRMCISSPFDVLRYLEDLSISVPSLKTVILSMSLGRMDKFIKLPFNIECKADETNFEMLHPRSATKKYTIAQYC
jgi:hypothetical protein